MIWEKHITPVNGPKKIRIKAIIFNISEGLKFLYARNSQSTRPKIITQHALHIKNKQLNISRGLYAQKVLRSVAR